MYICCIYVYFCCVRSLGHQTLRDSLEYMYICCICISVVFGAWISSLAGCICILVIYILSGICHICVYCLMGNAPLTSFLHTFNTKGHVSPIHCPKHCTLQCFGQWMGG